jgi:hypothetical protein
VPGIPRARLVQLHRVELDSQLLHGRHHVVRYTYTTTNTLSHCRFGSDADAQ